MALKFRRGAVGVIATICLSFGDLHVAIGEVVYEDAGALKSLCISKDVATKAVCEGFIGGVFEIVAEVARFVRTGFGVF